MSTNTPEPPTIWFKAQRVMRTIFAFLVVAVPFLNGMALVTVEYLNQQADLEVPGQVFLFLNGVIAVTAFLIGLVNAWMQTQGFNAFLTRFGLGSVPKQNLFEAHVVENGEVHVITEVIPDPKAIE